MCCLMKYQIFQTEGVYEVQYLNKETEVRDLEKCGYKLLHEGELDERIMGDQIRTIISYLKIANRERYFNASELQNKLEFVK